MTLQTLSIPRNSSTDINGFVKVTPDTVDQLKRLSLVSALNGTLYPAAGKSARLGKWFADNTKEIETGPRAQYRRFTVK